MLAATQASLKFVSMKQHELPYPAGPQHGVVWVDQNTWCQGDVVPKSTDIHTFHRVFTLNYMQYVPELNIH